VNITETLNFGKYNGRTIESIWTGVNDFYEIEVIKKYLFQLCSFVLGINDIDEIPCSKHDLSQNADELLYFSQSYVSKLVEITDSEISIISVDKNIGIALFNVLKNILTERESFITIPQYYSQNSKSKNIGHSLNSISFQFLQADPYYIKWCIENIDSFFFDPNDLDTLASKKCRFLSHFQLEKKSQNTFIYNPVFKESKFNFANSTILINGEKYSFKSTRKKPPNASSNHNNIDESFQFCAACHEMPCMCSDREESSDIYDF